MKKLIFERCGTRGERETLNVLRISDGQLEFMKTDGSTDCIAFSEVCVRESDDEIPDLHIAAALQVDILLDDNCWWPAEVQSCKGEFAICFLLYDNSQHVVDAARLRAKCSSQLLINCQLYMYDITMPQHVLADALNDKRLVRCLRSGCLLVQNNESLRVVSLDEDDIRRVVMIKDFIAKSAIQLATMRTQILKLQQQCQQSPCEEFTVKRELLGLAYGTAHSNINAARLITGVSSIEVNEGVFRIFGDSPDACKQARAQLEFVQKIHLVPSYFVPRIIGKGSAVIQEILNRSEIISIRVDDSVINNNISFEILGRADCVDSAIFMIDYYVDSLKDVAALEHQHEEVSKQLYLQHKPNYKFYKMFNKQQDDHIKSADEHQLQLDKDNEEKVKKKRKPRAKNNVSKQAHNNNNNNDCIDLDKGTSLNENNVQNNSDVIDHQQIKSEENKRKRKKRKDRTSRKQKEIQMKVNEQQQLDVRAVDVHSRSNSCHPLTDLNQQEVQLQSNQSQHLKQRNHILQQKQQRNQNQQQQNNQNQQRQQQKNQTQQQKNQAQQQKQQKNQNQQQQQQKNQTQQQQQQKNQTQQQQQKNQNQQQQQQKNQTQQQQQKNQTQQLQQQKDRINSNQNNHLTNIQLSENHNGSRARHSNKSNCDQQAGSHAKSTVNNNNRSFSSTAFTQSNMTITANGQ